MGVGNRGFIDPQAAATNSRRQKFEAAASAEQAKLGRKLTGHERSMLWSKFAPHFYIVKPPEPQRRKAAALGDRTSQTALWRSSNGDG